MIVRQGSIGRAFVLRLEDGDRLPDSIEAFAREHGVAQGVCLLLGGVGPGKLVVGPEDGAAAQVTPMIRALTDIHEAAAVGTLFEDESGAPRLHMHTAVGRGEDAHAGCVRQGVDVWKVAEVVVLELVGVPMRRKVDPAFGFELLSPDD